MILWSYKFYYSEKEEREFIFEQMTKILDKAIFYDIDIIIALFNALNQSHEKQKIIKLYKKIL